MSKKGLKIVKKIIDEERKIIAYQETNPETPLYYNDRINKTSSRHLFIKKITFKTLSTFIYFSNNPH